MKKIIIMACIVGVTLSVANEQSRGERDTKRMPPQDAIEVCEGQATDTACQMKSRHGDLVNGICKYTPDEKYFACKPERRLRKRD